MSQPAAATGTTVPPLELSFRGMIEWLVAIWRFQIVQIEGAPITVGSIVIFLLVLVAGFWLSRLVSRRTVRLASRRLRLDEGGAAALQSVLFYVLLVTVVLLAMHIINVPLTVFAVLGGAAAIGIGFGSQNIVNNFISGLIILVERPIRVGNLVQLQGVYGIVRHIGARSTRIVTGDNVEIIVPNSSFLENNVTNWTLSDDQVRAKVSVGVAYGSPTRRVQEILLRAADEHQAVLKDPPPSVVFAEFGDNALAFDLYFWVRIRRMFERQVIESDLRFRIDELCREGKVVIAFPQRDVHLDTLKPLEVRVLG